MFQERIERLKNDFIQTEKFIEREVTEQEEREKKQLLKEKRDSSEEREGQVQTQQPQGKKPIKFILTLGSYSDDNTASPNIFLNIVRNICKLRMIIISNCE